jgi:hypothetical protein
MSQLQLRGDNIQVSSIREAIKSSSPILRYIRNDESQSVEFLKLAYKQCYQFLLLLDMDEEKAKLIAQTFATDILETRDTWKIEDVVMFFKTVRQRQDVPEFQLMGNKITILKLSEMVFAYEGIRADESVEVHKQEAFKQIGEGVSERSQEWALEITERLKAKQSEGVDMTRAVETNNWHKENQERERELLEQVKAGTLTEDEYLQQYHKFLIR